MPVFPTKVLLVGAGALWLCLGASASSGGAPWEIFPKGRVPGEVLGSVGSEQATGGPGGPEDTNFFSVSTPLVQPFIVPPTQERRSDAAVLVIPGGGYVTVSWGREGVDIARWLNSIGVSAFVLKYRVPLRSWSHTFAGAQLMDAQRAMRLIRSSAHEHGLNSSRVGAIGFSAGGHLAAFLVNGSANSSYAPIDAADQLSSRPDFLMFVYPWSLVDHYRGDVLIFQVDSGHPPSFFAQTYDDAAPAENSLVYFAALKAARAQKSELHIFPRGGHGYGRCSFRSAVGDVCTWSAETPVECAWQPWFEACSWPARAERFLWELGLFGGPETTEVAPKMLYA